MIPFTISGGMGVRHEARVQLGAERLRHEDVDLVDAGERLHSGGHYALSGPLRHLLDAQIEDLCHRPPQLRWRIAAQLL